jgi:hypothetical protein
MLGSSLVFCTLLGPEGPGQHFGVVRTSGPSPFGARSSDFGLAGIYSGQKEYRPYFENYTVDASILDSNRKVRIT